MGITSIFPGLPFAWYSNACCLRKSFCMDMFFWLRAKREKEIKRIFCVDLFPFRFLLKKKSRHCQLFSLSLFQLLACKVKVSWLFRKRSQSTKCGHHAHPDLNCIFINIKSRCVHTGCYSPGFVGCPKAEKATGNFL